MFFILYDSFSFHETRYTIVCPDNSLKARRVFFHFAVGKSLFVSRRSHFINIFRSGLIFPISLTTVKICSISILFMFCERLWRQERDFFIFPRILVSPKVIRKKLPQMMMMMKCPANVSINGCENERAIDERMITSSQFCFSARFVLI